MHGQVTSSLIMGARAEITLPVWCGFLSLSLIVHTHADVQLTSDLFQDCKIEWQN